MALDSEQANIGSQMLRIFRRESAVTVLGPGRRAVIWVQGCPFACKGCIVPESWPTSGAEIVSIDELAEWVLEQPGLEGVTFSGGEPMEQAGALGCLVEKLRAVTDLGVVCYTGYRLEVLQSKGSNEQRALLAQIDLLIDGVYIEGQHADLRWRGSSNQRLLPLTNRYREEMEAIVDERDRSAGLEFFLDDEGKFGFAGVPAEPGFRDEFEARLKSRGVSLG